MAKAAVTRRIRDDHQKNFLKIFNSLTGKHSRWEIWEDFVTLTAIEISNSTDKVNAPERTKMYQTIVSKYSAKERDGMVEMLAEVIMGMEQNPDQDFLGSLYMMCELGNDHAGQFFTPYDVCRCMAEITFDPKLHPDMEGFISVSDPACGAGATLLAFLNVCKRRNICYHNKVLVIAQDIDFIVGLMCYIDGLCDDDGNTINLTYNQALVVDAAGICTFLNFMGGWTAWGNHTACYPKSTDVKDYFIPLSRMFDYVTNTLIKTFWSKLDKPMNRRLIDTILDSANIWLNGLVGAGYLLGASVEMLESENPLTSLMAGKIKLHVYMTPPSPAQEIDFVLEYDADYVTSALQS